MIETPTGEAEARRNVIGFEVRQFIEDLLKRQSGCEEVQYVHDADAHTTHAWLAATLGRIDRDTFCDRRHVLTHKYVTTVPAFLPHGRAHLAKQRHAAEQAQEIEFRLVRKRGLEPPRPCGHKLLRLARLPVPPLPHRGGKTLGESFTLRREQRSIAVSGSARRAVLVTGSGLVSDRP